jgi:hypothetical protein
MNFSRILPALGAAFDSHGIRYALIGGLAMAARGVQRSTLDADFILLLEDLDAADRILRQQGFQRAFRSENVSHYTLAEPEFARVDLLHAFRGPSLGMLNRAERLASVGGYGLPVVHPEDLIGLKLQAMVNDPSREPQDWADMLAMVRHAGRSGQPLDWELLGEYFELFERRSLLDQLISAHGQAH